MNPLVSRYREQSVRPGRTAAAIPEPKRPDLPRALVLETLITLVRRMGATNAG